MAEATQQYVPVQSQSVAPAVGAAPGMPQDTMFESVYNYAQKQNVTNLQTAREEEYVEGQLLAAQNNGVQEVRESQPWVSQIFGGGAALSGAMDYMEQTKLLEYQEDINNNMDEYRRMRPEDFKTQQMEKIKQFYTDDDETNQHIMRTFGMALPSIVNTQSKAHEGFKQEQHLSKMTTFVNMSLRVAQRARESGDDADKARAEGFLDNSLKMPVGMNKDAYKQFLYSELQLGAAGGDTAVAAKIADLGLINTPEDQALLEKADVALAKYQAERETFEAGSYMKDITVAAMDMNITPGVLGIMIHEGQKKYHFSKEKVAEFFMVRERAILSHVDDVDLQHNVDLIKAGGANNIPESQRKQAWDVFAEAAKTDDDALGSMVKNLSGVSYTINSLKERWRAGVSTEATINDDGLAVATPELKDTFDYMDKFKEMTDAGNDPSVFSRHTDPYTAAVYKAYTTARSQDKGASQDTWILTAQGVVRDAESSKGGAVGAGTITTTSTTVTPLIEDIGVFSEDELATPIISGAIKEIIASSPTTLAPGTLAARVNAALLNDYSKQGDTWVKKRNGQTLDQETGVEGTNDKIKSYVRATTPGWYREDFTISRGSGDWFNVYNSHGQVDRVVKFEELSDFHKNSTPAKDSPTAQAALKVQVRKARRGLTAAGYGLEDMAGDHPGEYYSHDVVAEMDDQTALLAYDAYIDKHGEHLDAFTALTDMMDEFVVEPLDRVYSGAMKQLKGWFGAEEKVKEQTKTHAQEALDYNVRVGKTKGLKVSELQRAAGSEVDGLVGVNTFNDIKDTYGISYEQAKDIALKAYVHEERLFAVGKWQLTRDPMLEFLAKYPEYKNKEYNATNQEFVFDEFLLYHQPAMNTYMHGGGTVNAAYKAALQEWTSLKDRPKADVIEALKQARDVQGGTGKRGTTWLKKLVAQGESDGSGGYAAWNRGSYKALDGTEPIIYGGTADILPMTFLEIASHQRVKL